MLSSTSKQLARRVGSSLFTRNARISIAPAVLASSTSNLGHHVFFSTKPATADPLYDLQRHLWSQYLASARGADYLFSAIDTDATGKVTPKEVSAFVESVAHEGNVREEAFQALQNLADDHSISKEEFLRWLVSATKFSGCCPASVEPLYHDAHPHVGPRGSSLADPDARQQYTWNKDTMAQNLRRMEYAVRGKIVMKAEEMQAQGRDIVYTNIGNPHGVGQHPLTYNRQVLALCDLPAEVGVDHPDVEKMFPKDVIEKAKKYRAAIGPSGTGAYTHSTY